MAAILTYHIDAHSLASAASLSGVPAALRAALVVLPQALHVIATVPTVTLLFPLKRHAAVPSGG